MSRINIVCPSPALVPDKILNTIPKEQLYENLWIVDKPSYDACAVDISKNTNRLVKKCDDPLNINYYTIVFQQFSATANGLEFTPGKEYYFIATSDGTKISLTRTSGGHCTSKVMKMVVYVCVNSDDPKCQQESPTTAAPVVCPTIAAVTTSAPLPQQQCAGNYTTLHYTTLHYTTLHYTTLHYTTLHYTTLHYTTLHYTTLHYTTLHYTTRHDTRHYTTTLHTTRHDTTTLHYTTRHYTTRHDTTRHDTTRHDTTRHDTTRHDTTRHDTTRHDTTRHDTTRRHAHHDIHDRFYLAYHSSSVISIYNHTKLLPVISNQTSLIPRLLGVLQNLEAKLDTMDKKLENCTLPTSSSSPSTPVPTPAPILVSCQAYYAAGSTANGVYTINPDGLGDFNVYCDQTTDGGGWAVFQKRFNGELNFTSKLWVDYANGFGNLSGEFWLGLTKIHRLAAKPGRLRVDLGAPDGEKRFAAYNGFSVGDADSKYILTSGSFT
ncbi:hypothetical protein QZH41_009670, partial [Actinostola sp. cb2023]